MLFTAINSLFSTRIDASSVVVSLSVLCVGAVLAVVCAGVLANVVAESPVLCWLKDFYLL